MREIIFKNKDFLGVNNRGNVLIISLFILQILTLVVFNFSLNLNQLKKINQIDPTFECVKIQVIQEIKKQFISEKTNDFEVEIDGYDVQVIYGVDSCDVIFDGEHHVEMKIEFDIVFWALGLVEYDYDYWQ